MSIDSIDKFLIGVLRQTYHFIIPYGTVVPQ